MPKCIDCVYASVHPSREPNCSVTLKPIKDLNKEHECPNFHLKV